MTIRNLDLLLKPASIALIGASDRPQSLGATILRNLLAAGFAGPVYPVNSAHSKVAGLRAYSRVADLPTVPDLAVICTPPETIPELISALGAFGTRTAVVLTAGLGAASKSTGGTLMQAMLDAAKPYLLRVLGPNCVGLIVPGIGLNASFAHINALPGKVAFITQSGALLTGVLDWAHSRGIGFSGLVSVGERSDVDFGDLIDYYGSDSDTRAILLYIESIKTPRKFMSAARAAARNKPVIVVKSGRAPDGARAASSHSGALAGADDVFDAAIRRAGMLRVDTLAELFDAVQTLSHRHTVNGDRLAIMTNGGGAGVLAADWNALRGGRLAELSPQTIERLNDHLPKIWSHGNPVDIIGDAPIERYVVTLKELIAEPAADAVLFMHAPTAIVPSAEIAAACAPIAKEANRMVLGCWLGDASVAAAREIFHQADIANYNTPEDAVRAFHQLVSYRRNQEQLMQTPASIAEDFAPDADKVRALVASVLADGRALLTEAEAKQVLQAYQIPVVETVVASTDQQVLAAANTLGFPVVLKILSPDITHKTDVGGVALNIEDADELQASVKSMRQRVSRLRPLARIAGFTVQPMIHRPQAQEVVVGVATDPLFGPVILFGQGGTAIEVIGDRAIALPPLNQALAKSLVASTKVAKLLAGFRDRKPADLAALYLTLVKVSQLIVDIGELAELDINPLLIDDQGLIALDARIRVVATVGEASERMAIRPYPREWEETIQHHGRSLLLRPIRPEDEALHVDLLSRLTPQDIRMRIFYSKRTMSHSELARLTQIDYEREMAFIAIETDAGGKPESLGVVRVVADPDRAQAEFAIIVRSDMKGRGLGRILFKKMIRYCTAREIGAMVGDVLADNTRMLSLADDLGFERTPSDETNQIRVRLQLKAPS